VQEMRALRYTKLDADDFVAMKIHGVTPAFVKELATLGYRNVDGDDLVAMRIHGVTEANWRDYIATDPNWAESETPMYVGRCVAALAADPEVWRLNGGVYASWDLAERYGIEDADGRRPHWGRHIGVAVDDQWDTLVSLARSTFATSERRRISPTTFAASSKRRLDGRPTRVASSACERSRRPVPRMPWRPMDASS